MDKTEQAPTGTWSAGIGSARGIGLLTIGVMTVWVGFALVSLEPVGRHFVGLGALRLVLLVALLSFAVAVGAEKRRWGCVGLGLAAVGAVLNLVGGIGSVVTDGWLYNPFDTGPDVAPPWYAYVIGLSAFAFALGGILVGIAARSSGWPAVAAVLGGVLYPMAFVMQGVLGHDPGDLIGHLIWIAPWFALAVGLFTLEAAPAGRATDERHQIPAQ